MFNFKAIEVTPFAQNARILWDTQKLDRGVVVDPGGDATVIASTLKELGVKCAEIWLTHSHLDHCGGVAELQELTGAKLLGHQDERIMRSSVLEICRMYGMPAGDMRNCPEPDRYIAGGEILKIGEHDLQVIFTPGHSPGHVCFYQPQTRILIGGDVLFNGSIGRTDLPGGDYDTLMQSIQILKQILPEDTAILPGHGPDTTLGNEIKHNPFLTGAFR